jgi:DNA-binding NarL/FixJ family response regulator
MEGVEAAQASSVALAVAPAQYGPRPTGKWPEKRKPVYAVQVISVLVADDHGVVREGIQRVLESEPDIKVCAEAADGHEVLEQVEKHAPDILILDISMPRLSGLETLERVRARYPAVKTVLLSFRADAPLIRSAVALGADGYLLKNANTDEILVAIREIVRGGCYFSPPVAREIVQQMREPARKGDEPFTQLSTREREVLRLIAEGLSAKEIAGRLGISAKTVEAHRTSLMRKLGVRKATELVRYAVRHGLIEA